MKCWWPNLDNERNPLERGPTTRRLGRRRRTAKKTLSILARLSGETLARWATRAAGWYGIRNVSVRFDRRLNLYLVYDEEIHAFSHPKRLWTLFSGHVVRGKSLAYQYLLDQIDFTDGDRIIDVGANSGDLALSFRAMQRKVHIEAFEPSPGDFTALQQNLANCSAVIGYNAHQVALWSENSDGLTFYLKPRKADSSILPIEGATGQIKVPGRRLDDILTSTSVHYRLLKLEAEGAEPEILQGAENILPFVDYISVDVGFERGKAALSTLPEVTNFLSARGFKIVGFEAGRYVLLFANESLAETQNVL